MKIDEPKSMREIHEIREKIWDDIKDLSPQEIIAYYKRLSGQFEQESGIKLRKLQKV
jgi:hypothetical protein